MKYAEVNGGSIIRMEPRALGTNYGPTGQKTELEATAQARRAHNERCWVILGFSARICHPSLRVVCLSIVTAEDPEWN